MVDGLTMIKGDSLEDRQRIQEYISATTEALILNQRGMPMDGADELTSQMLTPINTYNEIIVHGNLRNWVDFLNQKKLPDAMEKYRSTVFEVLKADWGNLHKLMEVLK